jgi:hypothetical protein
VSGAAGDGEVRVRIRCTRTGHGGLSARGDLLKIVYEAA